MPSTRISRGEFLGMSALAGAGMMMAGRIPAALATPLSLDPYAVPLPIPPKAVETGGVINISAQQFTQRLHPNLPNVTVWGYSDGAFTHYPGPTIEVHKNRSTTVHFTNDLPGPHPYIPIATQAPDGRPFPGVERGPGPRILTHLHGGFVTGTSDGNPYATQNEYTTGQTQTVTYPAHPRATTLWYHDHALGMTRLNVYAGLAGFVRMRDDFDTGQEPNPLGIPGGRYEVPIAIQDKSFTDADGGQLFYSPDESWIPEFFGDTPVVNGAVQPYLEVEPRMYRLTFLNGSQARFYHLQLSNGRPFYQIGSEGGMFNKPVRVNSILLLPAERADVIVDFSGLGGQDIELNNLPLPAGVISPATPDLLNLMQFRVRGTPTTPGPQAIPKTLAGGSLANAGGPIAKKRYITLEERLEGGNPVRLVINGRRFEETVDEAPRAGTVEEWRFVNISADTHPIHMHLTNFQVMGRTPLDGPGYAAALAAARDKKPGAPPLLPNNTIDPTPFLLGPEVPPPRNEKGWKDTVGAHPDQVLRIRQRFELPAGASLPQKYVYHCHILEHEDNDMMRPFQVE